MVFYSLLTYGAPVVVAITAVYIGYRGLKFYINEVASTEPPRREEAVNDSPPPDDDQ